MSWSPFLDFRFYVVLALGLAGLLALAQRLARAPSARTMGLVALRGLILCILVVILLNPIRTEAASCVRGRRRPRSSCSTVRGVWAWKRRSRAARLPPRISRLERSMPRDRRPRVQSYRFGKALEVVEETDHLPVPEPRDDETRLICGSRNFRPGSRKALRSESLSSPMAGPPSRTISIESRSFIATWVYRFMSTRWVMSASPATWRSIRSTPLAMPRGDARSGSGHVAQPGL